LISGLRLSASARQGFRLPEGLQPQFARRDLWQVAPLLLLALVPQEVPMMYIWAWAWPAAVQPDALASSRITAAARKGSPDPPYSPGIGEARNPLCVSSVMNSVG
jgi:hypothetical protein